MRDSALSRCGTFSGKDAFIILRKRIYRLGILFIVGCLPLFADSYSGAHDDEAMIVRAPVWVFLEPQPSVMTQDEQGKKLPPRKALTEVSKMLMEGMTFGWCFSYTPSDARRQVAEDFTLTPVHTIDLDDGRLTITELKPRYPYLYCWTEYRITDAMAMRKREWTRANYITAKGSGSGARVKETEGIKQAYTEAARSAIRGYLKKNEKNKPQYVSGEMLIKDNPRLYATGGSFKAELTVYLYIKEVIPYSVF